MKHSTKRVRLLSRAAVVALLGSLPSGAGAQMTPGARLPARETVRAQFIADVVQGVDETRRSWMEEVQQDDLDEVMRLYTAEAVVIPPGGLPQKGTEEVRAFWEATLPRIGSVEAGMIDVDASGQMAMVAGSYSMEWRLPTGSSMRESGGLLTVYVRNGRRWLIRAQVFGGEMPAALQPETGGGEQPD